MSHKRSLVSFALAGAGAFALARSTPAGLVGTTVDLGPEQHPDQGIVTYRVYLVFNTEVDDLIGVVGPVFETDGPELRQNCSMRRRQRHRPRRG